MTKNAFSQKIRRRFGLQERLGVMFISLVLLTGLTIALIGHYMVNKVEVSLTRQLADNISQTVLREIEHSVYDPVQPLVSALAHGMFPKVQTERERLQLLPMLRTFMNSYAVMGGVHIGYANGDYLMLRKLSSEKEKQIYRAPPGSAYVLLYIERGKNGSQNDRVIFYDRNLTVLQQLSNKLKRNYDPRVQPWYQRATGKGQVETGPFIMTDTAHPAITFSERSQNGNAVVAIDIVLTQLSEFLGKIRPTPGARIGLFQADGILLANDHGITKNGDGQALLRTRDDLSPIIKMGLRQYERGERGLDLYSYADGRSWVLFLEELKLAAGIKNFIVLAIPRDEILDESEFFKRYVAYAALGILIVTAVASWLAVRFVFSPIRKLAKRAQSLKDFPLEKNEERVVSSVAEIDALSRGMEDMQENIQRLFSIIGTINAEKDFPQLLRSVLRDTMSVSGSDGSVISLLDEDGKAFDDAVVCWTDREGKFQYFLMNREQFEGVPLINDVIAGKGLCRERIARSDPRSRLNPLAVGFEAPGVAGLDLVCLPLNGRMGEKLGMLGFGRRIRSGGESFQPQQLALIEGLAKFVAIALDNRRLLKKQRMLLDAVIQIVAGAIDAKSPHTGGHCERVPILFQMMLQAACDERRGTFKDFALDDDGWEEARLAAWLHDWGKVTTPEFVMDKATKLETMYDRIHEIRTRFEVLKRDADISCLRAILGGNDAQTETRKLQAALRELDDDFAFVARCNHGEERLGDEDLERLRQIGSRTWERTLDKRLGVSRDELARMEDVGGLCLPATEKLLADKEEHLIERKEADAIAPDNPWGFKIETPQYLYNRGELHNLSIRAGTLTEEERHKINDHITQTILMLDRVPLPEHLRNVPEIAGAHHETMDGRGYPRRLVREEMSWSARMMAVADIFEALTASDRPYKSSKTLSEALRIMEEFKKKNHIDPDVYALFLSADIPRKYAEQYLKPEQNDMTEAVSFS